MSIERSPLTFRANMDAGSYLIEDLPAGKRAYSQIAGLLVASRQSYRITILTTVTAATLVDRDHAGSTLTAAKHKAAMRQILADQGATAVELDSLKRQIGFAYDRRGWTADQRATFDCQQSQDQCRAAHADILGNDRASRVADTSLINPAVVAAHGVKAAADKATAATKAAKSKASTAAKSDPIGKAARTLLVAIGMADPTKAQIARLIKAARRIDGVKADDKPNVNPAPRV